MSLLESKQRARREPLYDIHPITGATIEVFYADPELAISFGLYGPGWVWWSCSGRLAPDGAPRGPHPSAFSAYREAMTS